jgi:hypothetical protein
MLDVRRGRGRGGLQSFSAQFLGSECKVVNVQQAVSSIEHKRISGWYVDIPRSA